MGKVIKPLRFSSHILKLTKQWSVLKWSVQVSRFWYDDPYTGYRDELKDTMDIISATVSHLQ
jgi:hypothetical protein